MGTTFDASDPKEVERQYHILRADNAALRARVEELKLRADNAALRARVEALEKTK